MQIKDFVSMSSTMFSFYFFLFCWSSLPSNGSVLKGNETDQLALLEFKGQITHDPLQVLSSWNDSNPFCQWKGVTCSRRHQRVTALNLPSVRLLGSLSPHIGNLSFLRLLNLQNNSFSDEIPQEIGNLFRLQNLSLSNNTFRGQIPANISHCVNLLSLRLGKNEFVGKLPKSLGSLTKLRKLVIQFNNLSGEIPPSLGNLSSLDHLLAAENQFLGRIPETLGQLKRMDYLSIGGNRLSGAIPPSIYNISSITGFYFRDNQLEGSLPSDLGFTLPNLEELNIANNLFTGAIPASISNASNLMRLVFPLNRISGKVPTLGNLHKLQWVSISSNQLGNGEEDDLEFVNSLVNASSLELLAIHNNNFGGTLPEAVGNLSTQLRTLSVADNQISGSIPTGTTNLVNLERLYLSDNQFTGWIPSSIGSLLKLQDLRFQGNNFMGEMPYSLGNLTLLTRLLLNRNIFQGSIPSSLGKCQNLIQLDLSINNLSGTIPAEVIGLSSLSIYLDLSQNQLTGSLPSNFGNLTNLGGLAVSDNKLSGQIPSSLGSCIRLEQLILKGNFFQGHIPSSLHSLKGIQYLDLSLNNFSGPIPKYFEDFSLLQTLNLSFNDFEGDVPIKGIFSNLSNIFLDGNDNLCGGISELHLSACSIKESKKTQSHSLKLILPIVIGILSVTAILCLLIIYQRRKSRREPAIPSTLLASVLQVSYENLLKATDGFSLENLIGVGSFGSVFKGILNHDDQEMVVAVKVLNLQHRGATKSFMAECEALRSIRHRNLVKIISACASVDFQGNDFKALIYEFMDNGSLEEWLHPKPATDEASKVLNLLQRLNISIDVASALDYLHHHCEIPIVHCDLKPSNVLLNNEIIGHVGDFGLAKFLPEAASDLPTNQSSSIGLRGTVGYAAPEYGMGREVSTQGDVYSFGILLLEMFTGMRPTDEKFTGNLNLHSFVKEALPEQLTEIVDPILLVEREEGEASEANARNRMRRTRSYSVPECLVSILGIGLICSSELPKDRLNMEEAVAQLVDVRNKLTRARTLGERQAMRTVQPVGNM